MNTVPINPIGIANSPHRLKLKAQSYRQECAASQPSSIKEVDTWDIQRARRGAKQAACNMCYLLLHPHFKHARVIGDFHSEKLAARLPAFTSNDFSFQGYSFLRT